MNADLIPYPAYKDSGVPWLGEVPEHWGTAAVKRHYAIQLGKMLQGRPSGPCDVEVPYLKAQHVQWFAVRTTNAPKMWASPSDLEQYGVGVGDLLVCEGGEGGRSGIVGEIEVGFIIQNALHRVRPLDQCQNGFLQYVMSAVAAKGWFDAINNKATIAHFTREKFGALQVPMPTVPEQAAIIRFLDHVNRRIRRYIRGKQKLITLLEEQKQTIIHRAVTRGLDPNVRLKPSGVEWLGNLPEHWNVRLLGRCLKRIDQGWSPVAAEGELAPDQWAVLTLSSVKGGEFDPAAIKPVSVNARVPSGIEIGNGDLLVTRSNTRELVGDVCLTRNVRPRTLICDLIYRLVPDAEAFNSRFLMFQLLSRTGRNQIERDARGSSGTMPKIAQRHIRSWQVIVPPLHEQESIAAAIEEMVTRAQRAVGRTHEEISLLREYRTRLIAGVVTGKLDVRDAAAKLPEEMDESETPDNAESSIEDDEARDDTDLDATPQEAEA